MMQKPTETAVLSQWELTDSGQTAGEPSGTELAIQNVGYS